MSDLANIGRRIALVVTLWMQFIGRPDTPAAITAAAAIWSRAVGFGCVAIIVFLSLIPGQWQERTALPGPFEHFLAYLGAAAILGEAAPVRRRPTYMLVALTALSGALEVLQHWSPGRDPQWIDFFASSAGAVVGGLLADWVRSRWWRATAAARLRLRSW